MDNPYKLGTEEFWQFRLDEALRMKEPHRAIYNCSDKVWSNVQKFTKTLIEIYIQPKNTVIDVGCGIGSIAEYIKNYLYIGVDKCQCFVEFARKMYPHHTFEVTDILKYELTNKFDWIIARDVGDLPWQKPEYYDNDLIKKFKELAKQTLIINYSHGLNHWVI